MIVECGLLDLVGVRANAFFGAVWRLKLLGAGASDLVPEQEKFKKKYAAMQSTIKRARHDPRPTIQIIALLRTRVSGECATRIAQYTA